MRLLLTRPQHDGERTAARLRARGHEVTLAPLLRIDAVDVELPGEPLSAVVMTSANAARVIARHPRRERLIALTAERAFLTVLEGSCRTPIAGHAVVAAGRLRFRGLIAKPDGSGVFETKRQGAAADAVRLGAEAGRELKQRAGADFFAPV